MGASGRIVVTAGQIGWNPLTGEIETDEIAAQTRQALMNVVAVLRAGDAEPSHVVRMTWFITDRKAYVDARRKIGRIYKEIFGEHYPAMTVVVVTGLLEDRAMVEIEATAVVPHTRSLRL
ncbi:MAG: RidA family protein [Gemmatimonadaceae bacterium]